MSEALLFIGAPSLSSLRSLDGTIADGFAWETKTLDAQQRSKPSSHLDAAVAPESEDELSLELLSTYWSQMQPTTMMPVHSDLINLSQHQDAPNVSVLVLGRTLSMPNKSRLV